MSFKSNTTEHAFKTFNRDLKDGGFSPVIIMYGEEDYLVNWAVESLVKKFVNPGMKAMDYQVITDDDLTADNIIEACETFSMLSEKRVVWARDFAGLKNLNSKGFSQAERDKLLQYMMEPNEGTILVISNSNLSGKLFEKDKNGFFKSAEKICDSYAFGPLDMPSLMSFCEKRFREASVEIDRSTVRLLIDESGYFHRESEYRIYNLKNDIQKIVAHSDGVSVTDKDVLDVISGDENTFIFDFLDAATMNKKDVAFEILRNMLQAKTDVFSILGALVSQFELILEVKEFKSDGMNLQAVMGKYKAGQKSEYRYKKAMAYADRYEIKKLKEILSQLYETDRNIKTGDIDQNIALELILGRI